MHKHLALRLKNVVMVRAERLRPARQRRLNAPVLLQPGGMDAVARAENRRAGDALMALYNIKRRELRGGRRGKARLARLTVAKRRIDRQRLPARAAFPLAGNQRDIQLAALRKHIQRARHETFCAAVGVPGLPDDGKLHAGVSSSRVSMALSTCCGVMAVIQSETPLSPQPALPQG